MRPRRYVNESPALESGLGLPSTERFDNCQSMLQVLNTIILVCNFTGVNS